MDNPSTSNTSGREADVIAVIAAAIAAYESDQGLINNLIVRKINRASGQWTTWNNAGREECIASRRF